MNMIMRFKQKLIIFLVVVMMFCALSPCVLVSADEYTGDCRWDFFSESEISQYDPRKNASLEVDDEKLLYKYSSLNKTTYAGVNLPYIDVKETGYSYVKLYAKLPSEISSLRLASGGISGALTLSRAGDGYQLYVFDVSDVAESDKPFRLDLITASTSNIAGEVEIDWIIFSSTSESINMVQSIQGDVETVNLGSTESPTAFKLGVDLYNVLNTGVITALPDGISIVCASELTNVVYSGKITDCTDFKIIDLKVSGTLSDLICSRCYRIIIYPKMDYKVTNIVISGVEGMQDFNTDIKEYSCEISREMFEEFDSSFVEVSASIGVTYDVNVQTINSESKKVTIVAYAENEQIDEYTIVCTRKAPSTYINITNCNYDGKIVTFSGSLTGAIVPVNIVAFKNEDDILNGDKLLAWEMVTPEENGEFSGSFGIRDAEETIVDCFLNVTFSVPDNSDFETVRFFNGKKIESLIETLDSSTGGLFEYMVNSNNGDDAVIYRAMGVDLDVYSAHTPAVQIKINEAASSLRGNLNNDNIAFLTNATLLIFELDDMSNEQIISDIEELEKGKQKISVWNNTNFSDLSDTVQNTVISNMVANIPDGGYKDAFEFLNAVKKSMLFELINSKAYTQIDEIILSNTDVLLYPETDISGTALATLSNAEATYANSVMNTLKTARQGVMFNTTNEFITALDNAFINTPNGQGGGGGGTGGGFGGSAGGSSPSKGSGEITTSISLPSQLPTEQKEKKYSDIANHEWAEDAISYLDSKGIVNGVGNGLFEPSRAVSRVEFLKMLCEAFKLETTGGNALPFADVSSDDWYATYVNSAYSLKIVNGVSNTEFGSNGSISREDAAVMIYRTMLSTGKNVSVEPKSFADSSDVADYALNAVETLCGAEIVNGVGENQFSPKRSITRAEAAVIIYRCILKFAL